MIKLYHAPISPNSRRVWITLIEKGLDFELIELKLDGEQFRPDFLAINPFSHIPTLVDDGFNVVESLAILDYLEAKYPQPRMLPENPQDLAIVKMVELVTANELYSATTMFLPQILGLSKLDPEKADQAKQKITVVLKFFENLLGDRPYFGSEEITLAEVVAGTVIPLVPQAGIPLENYPKINTWCNNLIARPAWQTTQVTPQIMEDFKSVLKARMSKN
ncbi:MAG: glutathione S-transferase family protein [Cuspidothrix sp.]